MWYLLATGELRRRYARSKLGQVWILLSTAIMITSMGLVWSHLWKQPVAETLPFIAVGMVTWQLINGIATEATTVLSANENYFHNQYLPASTIIYSLIYKHVLTFAMNIVVPITIALVFGSPLQVYALASLWGLTIVLTTCFWVGFMLAILCTWFRDLTQIVASILQITFFLTPVIWKPETLAPAVQYIATWNPFSMLLSVIRDPMLNRSVEPSVWVYTTILAFGGLALSLPFIGRFRRRLIYWL